MKKRKQESTTYVAALAGASMLVRLLLFILAGVILIFLARSAYIVGYALFHAGNTSVPWYLAGLVKWLQARM